MKKKNILIALLTGVVIIISITFFIFTTTMSQPTAMKFLQPKEHDSAKGATIRKGVVTLVLFNDNDIYAYRGTEYSNGNVYKTTDSSLRKYLLQIKKEVNDSNFQVIIKVDTNATYKNTVTVLDEMTINNIKRYAMIDVMEPEKKIIDSLRKG